LIRAVLVTLVALVAISCSHTSGGIGSSKSASILTFTGLAGEPDSLNTLISTSTDLDDFSHLYFSYLVDVDDHGRFIPEIAARVPTVANGDISHDGLTIVYHLRHGVKWQDGAPLTARDVIFTYRAMINPKNNVPNRVGYDHIKSVSAPDPYTVIVHLAKPFSAIIAYFEAPQDPTSILPAHLLEHYSDLNHVPFNVLPVGSGPFRVVQWQHGDHITLEANPLYWRGKPKIDKIIYKIIPDHVTQLEELRTGEVDAYFTVDPQLLPETKAIFTPIPDFHDLHFNLRDPVVGDVRVRQAVARAIDRSRLIQAATHGAGIATDSDEPLLSWAYDAHLPHIPYEPSVSRRLLDEAGWRAGANGMRSKNGASLTVQLAISPTGVGGSRLAAAVIQRYLREVGIDVTIKEYPSSLMWATPQSGGPLTSGRYQMAYDAWWILGPDPDDSWQLGCDQIPPAGQNEYFWCNRRADRAMYDALATFDEARRAKDYAIVQEELVHDIPLLPLWQVKRPDAYTNRLHGVSPSPAGSTFWNAWAWSLAPK
jgi:peptide/nickel transport system substrate-binding protein